MSVGRTGGVEDRKNQIQTARQSGVMCDVKYEYDEASIRAAVKEYCASISPEPTKEEDVYKRQHQDPGQKGEKNGQVHPLAFPARHGGYTAV